MITGLKENIIYVIAEIKPDLRKIIVENLTNRMLYHESRDRYHTGCGTVTC